MRRCISNGIPRQADKDLWTPKPSSFALCNPRADPEGSQAVSFWQVTKPMVRQLLALLLAVIAVWLLFTVAGAQPPQRIYVPMVALPARPSPFGFESFPYSLIQPQIRLRAEELGAAWIRLNGVLWHEVQPDEHGPYRWEALDFMDQAIATARAAGLTPVVTIRGTPLWAAVVPANCAAVRDDRLEAFGAFLEALARRYRDRVQYWELGNEPDVDPRLIPGDWPFGCMGDIDDPYYGGERYGRMLQVAAPALRRGNPQARVVFGGLLLDSPRSSNPERGNPERFLEGALRAGGGDYFDILAYHAYPIYFNDPAFTDHDLDVPSPWNEYGGRAVGKARFLREVMARYGVQKPLWLNETSMVCPDIFPHCDPPDEAFFLAKARLLVRMVSRVLAEDVEQIIWYTLEGPGWLSTSLLDAEQKPRPAYRAFQWMAHTVLPFYEVVAVDYGPRIEAYRFIKGPTVVDALWSRDAAPTTVTIANDRFLASIQFDGTTPAMFADSSVVHVRVGLDPVYIERKP